jgi:hypothetical protein
MQISSFQFDFSAHLRTDAADTQTEQAPMAGDDSQSSLNETGGLLATLYSTESNLLPIADDQTTTTASKKGIFGIDLEKWAKDMGAAEQVQEELPRTLTGRYTKE